MATLIPLLALLLGACEGDAAQLVHEIDDARAGCTNEMLEAGAEECVQMFEKYIEMGSGAIDTYIGAVRAFDAAVDRTPVYFDTLGLGHAISPGLMGQPGVPEPAGLPQIGTPRDDSRHTSAPAYSAPPGTRSQYPPAYTVPESPPQSDIQPSGDYRPPVERDDRRPGSSIQPTETLRGAIRPPAERLERPWLGDEERRNDYYPDEAPVRGGLKPQANEPKTGRTPAAERRTL